MSQTTIVPPAEGRPLTGGFGALLAFYGVGGGLGRVLFSSGMDFDLDWAEFVIELSVYGFAIAAGFILLCFASRSIIKGTIAVAVIAAVPAALILANLVEATVIAWVAG